MLKDRLSKTSGWQFHMAFWDFRETGPRSPQGNRGNRACAMKPSVAILRNDFTVRNWARSCYVFRIKKYPDLASTRFRIHIGLKNIHSGERILKVPDSPANSPDTCARRAYIRKEKVADSKVFGYVWTGPK